MTPPDRLAALAIVCVMLTATTSAAAERPARPPAPVSSSSAALRDGAAKFAQGQLRDAEAVLARATRLAPREGHGWLWLGVVRYHRGEYAGAAAAFDVAARLQPRDGKALLWWGQALLRAGQVADAEEAFQRASLTHGSSYVREMALQALRATRPLPSLAASDQTVRATAPAWVVAVESYRALARHYNPRLRPEEADLIAQSLLAFSRQFNLDPRLVVALVVVESGFQPRARSRAGALGLGQLMPETARSLGVDPLDPAQNLYGTIRYLRGNLDRFGWNNVHLALAAYNAGRGAVERYEGIPPYSETQWYVHNVDSLYRRLLSSPVLSF